MLILPQEAYELIWDDLLHQSKKYGFEIRSIWMADMVNMGSSGVLNEPLLGDDREPDFLPTPRITEKYQVFNTLKYTASYLDHSRDLLHMVNVFRERMPRPIIGIGHSAGATGMSGNQPHYV